MTLPVVMLLAAYLVVGYAFAIAAFPLPDSGTGGAEARALSSNSLAAQATLDRQAAEILQLTEARSAARTPPSRRSASNAEEKLQLLAIHANS